MSTTEVRATPPTTDAEAMSTDQQTRARRALPLPDLRLAAVAGAVVLALWPGRVPHGAGLTAVTGGILGAVAWGVASLVVRGVRAIRERDEDEASARCRSRARMLLTLLAWAVFVGAAAEGIALAHGADVRLAHSLRAAAPSLADHLAGAVGAALVATLLVNLPRIVQAVARATARARAARMLAA